jgi:hypothetical protein
MKDFEPVILDSSVHYSEASKNCCASPVNLLGKDIPAQIDNLEEICSNILFSKEQVIERLRLAHLGEPVDVVKI